MGEGAHSGLHLQGALTGPPYRQLERDVFGRKESNDGVAREFDDLPVVDFDQQDHQREILVDELGQLFRPGRASLGQPFAERSKTGNIGQ